MAILSHRELLSQARATEESNWLVEGLVGKASLGVVGAVPKCGKTWFCLSLAQAVSTGTPFLGHFRTAKARTLFVELEDSPQMLAQRSVALVRGQGLAEPEPGFLQFMFDGVRIDLPRGVEQLRRALSETQARLLIVDTLNRSHGLNENVQAHASQLIIALDKLRREFGCSILCTHHTAKVAQGGQGGKALRGSSVLHAGLENSAYLWRTESPGTIKVEPESKLTTCETFFYRQVSSNEGLKLEYSAELPSDPMVGKPGAGIAFLRRVRGGRRR